MGSLEIDPLLWIDWDQDGLIHQVGVGDYLYQWGRIERIEEAHVELVEIVSNGGGGWLRRPRTIEMNQAVNDDDQLTTLTFGREDTLMNHSFMNGLGRFGALRNKTFQSQRAGLRLVSMCVLLASPSTWAAVLGP